MEIAGISVLKSILNNTAGQMYICSLRLREVFYNRTLADDTISVSQLADAGFGIKFTKYSCHIMDDNDNTIAAAPRMRIAYFLQCFG